MHEILLQHILMSQLSDLAYWYRISFDESLVLVFFHQDKLIERLGCPWIFAYKPPLLPNNKHGIRNEILSMILKMVIFDAYIMIQ